MNNLSSSDRNATLIVMVVLGIYLAGYAAIRLDSDNLGPDYIILPRSLVNDDRGNALFYLYKPLLFTEHRLTGHNFTLHPWSGIRTF